MLQVEALLLQLQQVKSTRTSRAEIAMMKHMLSQDNNDWFEFIWDNMKEVFCSLVAVILSAALSLSVSCPCLSLLISFSRIRVPDVTQNKPVSGLVTGASEGQVKALHRSSSVSPSITAPWRAGRSLATTCKTNHASKAKPCGNTKGETFRVSRAG